MPRTILIALWSLNFLAATSHADLIYNFSNGTGQGTNTDPSVSISNFLGSGVIDLGYSGTGNPNPGARGHGFSGGSSTSNSNYFYFEITPDSNTLIDLTSLSFDEFAENGPGSNRGPTTWQIRINNVVIGAPQSTNFGSYGGSPHDLDLTSLPYFDQTVRIELHSWGARHNNTNNEWFIDNVSLAFATVAVPEPGTSLLLFGAFGSYFGVRRRTKQKAESNCGRLSTHEKV